MEKVCNGTPIRKGHSNNEGAGDPKPRFKIQVGTPDLFACLDLAIQKH